MESAVGMPSTATCITSRALDGNFGFVADIGASRQGLEREPPDACISCTATASFGQGRLAVASGPSPQNVFGQCEGLPSAQLEHSLHVPKLLDGFGCIDGCAETRLDAGTATTKSEPSFAAIFGPASLYCDPVKRKPRKYGHQHSGVLLSELADESVGEPVHPSDPKLADVFGCLSEEGDFMDKELPPWEWRAATDHGGVQSMTGASQAPLRDGLSTCSNTCDEEAACATIATLPSSRNVGNGHLPTQELPFEGRYLQLELSPA